MRSSAFAKLFLPLPDSLCFRETYLRDFLFFVRPSVFMRASAFAKPFYFHGTFCFPETLCESSLLFVRPDPLLFAAFARPFAFCGALFS